MDIHKPKPTHSWRDFAVEVGTIVLGVLIAIAGEQTVEALIWTQRVAAAKAAMTRELAADDAPEAFERVAVAVCLNAQINALQRGLVDERDRGVPFHPAPLKIPNFGTYDSFAWRSAESAGVTSHLSGAQMAAWANAYTFVPVLDEAARREVTDYADLSILTAAPAHPDAGLRQQLLTEIARLRGDNQMIARSSVGFLNSITSAGIVVPQKERTRLPAGPGLGGDCGDAPTAGGPAHAAEQAAGQEALAAALARQAIVKNSVFQAWLP